MRRWFLWVAVGGLLIELLAWVTRTDLCHWVRMREQVSDAWTGGGCDL